MDFLQPPDPPEHGHCLRCNTFVTSDEQRAGICIDCQPAEAGEQPAFPVQASDYGGHGTCFGLTIRDYFASRAMQEIDWKEKPLNESAADCYRVDDAMLAARVKP